jgi:hypothetical protein
LSDFVLVGDKILNNLDEKILKAIKALSPTSFVGAAELSDKVKIDKKDLGNRVMTLKESGKVDIVTKEFVSSMTLPNFITKVRLTEEGREALKKSRSTSKPSKR